MLPTILTNATAVLNIIVGLGIAGFALYLFIKLRWWVDLGLAISGLAMALLYLWALVYTPDPSSMASVGASWFRQIVLAMQLFVFALEVERIKECR